ncbi:MAG: type II secretion system minor pseudopilin GspK [Thermodesulfobacteriota bacterium]
MKARGGRALKLTVLSESGVALIVALLITAILVTVVTEAVYAVHRFTSMTELYRDSERASTLAEVGVEIESALLREIAQEDKNVFLSAEDRERSFTEDGAEVTLSVVGEQGKISLNHIVTAGGKINKEGFERLVGLLEALALSEELAYALADWVDADSKGRSWGAESGYYEDREPGYRIKNGPLSSIEELLLVKGFDFETFTKLRPYVTVYTDGIININGAAPMAIMSLDSEISEDMANAVVSRREDRPFKSTAEVREISGFGILEVGFEKKIRTSGSIFRVESSAKVGESIREVEAVIKLDGKGRGSTSVKTLYWRER